MLHDISVTPEQLQAARAWVCTDPDSAEVLLRVDGGILTASQGDDCATWAQDGSELITLVSDEDAAAWRTNEGELRERVGADPLSAEEDYGEPCRWAVILERHDSLGAVVKVMVVACPTKKLCLQRVGDAVLDGYTHDGMYDLDTRQRIELHVALPQVTVSEDQDVMANHFDEPLTMIH
jgi:hypothetical protein